MARRQSGRSGRPSPGVSTAVVISVVLHGIVLAPLALDMFASRIRPPDPRGLVIIDVEVLPRPALMGDDATIARWAVTDNPNDIGSRGSDPVPSRPRPASLGPAKDTQVSSSQPPAVDARWRVRPDDPAQRIGDAMRRGAGGCRLPSTHVDLIDQAVCDQRFGEAAARARAITGTGDQDRDAQFASEGVQALADYERRRAPLKPNSRAQPCPHGTDIMGDCPVRVMVPLWSSTEGFLPGLKRDD